MLLFFLFSFWLADVFKKLSIRRFKSDRDEMWQDRSSSKYTSIDAVGFSIQRHTFKMAALPSRQFT